MNLYAVDCETGKEFEIGELVNLDTIAIDDEAWETPKLIESYTFSVSTKHFMAKTWMRLLGITNNSIRMHGGKPLRKVKERFL